MVIDETSEVAMIKTKVMQVMPPAHSHNTASKCICSTTNIWWLLD